jgi:hypothetical protein
MQTICFLNLQIGLFTFHLLLNFLRLYNVFFLYLISIPSMMQNQSPPTTYHYQKLAGPRHLRLLKLLENSHNGQVYNLIETLLDAAPAYEAISSVWGDQRKCETLRIQSSCLGIDITSSLKDALSQLRPYSKTRHLWIDQTCIDQTNIDERNQQVGIMGEIYRKSQRVLIWLGEQSADLPDLTTTLEFASSSVRNLQTFNQFSREIHSLLADSTAVAFNCHLSSLRQLQNLPLFGRAWIVQEAVLPITATMVLGSLVFDINALWFVVRKIRNIQDHENLMGNPLPGIRQLPGYLVLNEIIPLLDTWQNGATFRSV